MNDSEARRAREFEMEQAIREPIKRPEWSEQKGDAAFWASMRQALLAQVDAIERKLGLSPRTAELRRNR